MTIHVGLAVIHLEFVPFVVYGFFRIVQIRRRESLRVSSNRKHSNFQ